ncbi:MAG: ABC transporter permease [Candidatus Coatesbacteria bacterium]|nr:ABC transporter permease [Candidatus Coatesbacteria bacterium]
MAVGKSILRSLRQLYYSAWLGWQMEANWAHPFEFITYSLLKPICHVLILVFIYLAVKSGDAKTGQFFGMYVGNSFFIFVNAIMLGTGQIIHEDREHFRVLKYIYCSPQSIYLYLSGRTATKIILTAVSTIIMLIFGRYALGIPISLFAINYPLLLIALILGILGMLAFGIMVAGFFLVTARHGGVLSGGIAGLFYLASGTLFPLTVLPGWLQPVARIIPITYWIEVTRRAVLGASQFEGLENFTSGELVGILVVTTLATMAASIFFYRAMEKIALDHGYLDRVTHY